MHRKIKELCKKRGIAICRLEKELGFGSGYISKLATSTPSVYNASKIANYLEVPIEELIETE